MSEYNMTDRPHKHTPNEAIKTRIEENEELLREYKAELNIREKRKALLEVAQDWATVHSDTKTASEYGVMTKEVITAFANGELVWKD